MGLSSSDVIKYLLGGFSPLSWFSGGQQGVWYDPADLTTLFQDSVGTIPVTAVEQPVGLMLDKSGRGNHAMQATAGNRPTLSARVNLLLATDTLSTQSVTTQATTYKLYFTGSGSVTLSGAATGTYSAGSNTITCTSGTLTVTVSGSVLTADLRPANIGAALPSYQRVTTSTDYDTAGFPLYLKINGTSSAMATNSIDFTSTANMTVVVGVRKLSDAAIGTAIELGTSFFGAFSVFAPYTSAGTYGAGTASSGSIYQTGVASGFSVPISNVIESSFDLSQSALANQIKARVNGIDKTLTFTGTGTPSGNFMNGSLYLFARAGTQLWFNGQFYGAIICGAAKSANQITQAESYMNNKLGRIY